MIKQILNNKIFKTISEIADKNEIEVYVIGGFVRDYFLNRPSKDIDILVIGSGIDFSLKVAEELGIKKVSKFKTFGTSMFKYKNMEIEFVGARKESYSRESRNPIIENGTLDDDQKRRDFTINAMAFSLNKANLGELLDPFNGTGDLNEKIIRTPLNPDITFSDDPLRMLRAIRFATQLNFELDELVFNSIQKNKERINIITKERIVEELNKILLSPYPSTGFILLDKTGLLNEFFPEFVNLKGTETINGTSHKDNFFHSLEVVDNLAKKTDNLWLLWAGLLHDIGKPKSKRYNEKTGFTFHAHEIIGGKMVVNIFKNFKMPLNEKLNYVKKLVELHLRPIAIVKDVTDSAVRRLLFEAGNDIDDLMKLAEADITSKNEAKVKKYLSNFEIVRQKLIEIEEKDKLRNWQPPITGEEIMEFLKIKPSKDVGIIKNKIKDAILDGEIKNTKEEAFKYMSNQAKKLGLLWKH